MNILANEALTHAGKFHADDVFSAALLRICNPSIRIQRSMKVPEDFDGIVFDIGLGPYDHHQEDAPLRENSVPYAAFGLLWREFSSMIVSEKEAERFDEQFIQPLDLEDNTGCGHPLASVIRSFNPPWDSTISQESCFEDAVTLAKTILSHKFEEIHSIERAKSLVQTALSQSKDGIVILPKFAPWKSVLVGSEAEFVVYPSQRGGLSVQGVPRSEESSLLKFPFPAAWAGKTPQQLAAISGIPGLQFCHNHLFLITVDTLDEAITACHCAKNQA